MKHLKDHVNLGNEKYYISTTYTFDVGYESMVFSGEESVSLYFAHYKTEEEAIEGHTYILDNLEECLVLGKSQNWSEATGNDILDIIKTILRYPLEN